MNVSNVGDGVATATAEAVTTFQPAELRAGLRLRAAGGRRAEESRRPADADADSDPAATPAEPDDLETTVDCGFGGLTVIFRFPENRFFFLDLAAALDDRDPRLTR